MHSHLNFHQSTAEVAKVSNKKLQRSLAESALKHVAGGAELIEKTFGTQPIQPELVPPRAMNLLLHMGHTH